MYSATLVRRTPTSRKVLLVSNVLSYANIHSYLVYPGGPGPGNAWHFEISVTPNHIHFDGGKAIDMVYADAISTKSDKGVVIQVFLLKLTQRVPGRPKCT